MNKGKPWVIYRLERGIYVAVMSYEPDEKGEGKHNW